MTIKDKKLLVILVTFTTFLLIITLLIYIMTLFGARYRSSYYNSNIHVLKIKAIKEVVKEKNKVLQKIENKYKNNLDRLYSKFNTKDFKKHMKDFKNLKVLKVKDINTSNNINAKTIKISFSVKSPEAINKFIKIIKRDGYPVRIIFPLRMKYNKKSKSINVTLSLEAYHKNMKR